MEIGALRIVQVNEDDLFFWDVADAVHPIAGRMEVKAVDEQADVRADIVRQLEHLARGEDEFMFLARAARGMGRRIQPNRNPVSASTWRLASAARRETSNFRSAADRSKAIAK